MASAEPATAAMPTSVVAERAENQFVHLRLDREANALVPHCISLLHRRGQVAIDLSHAMQHDLAAFLVRYDTAPRAERAMAWTWPGADRRAALELFTDGLHRWGMRCRQGCLKTDWASLGADVTDEIERSAAVIRRFRDARDAADGSTRKSIEA